MMYPRRGRMKARSRNPLERGLPLEVLTVVFITVTIITIIAIIIIDNDLSLPGKTLMP